MTPKKSLKNVKPAGMNNSLIMTDSNKRTISAYEEHIAEYINGTPNEVTGDVKKWIDKTLIDLFKDVIDNTNLSKTNQIGYIVLERWV